MDLLRGSQFGLNIKSTLKQSKQMRLHHRVHLVSDLTGPFADDPSAFHGKYGESSSSSGVVVGLSLFFTSLIVAALFLIWYFYSKRNQQMGLGQQGLPSPHPSYGTIPYPPQQLLTAFNNGVPSMGYPFPVIMPAMVHQQIQTSGSMYPYANTQAQTSNIMGSVPMGVQTSAIPPMPPTVPIEVAPLTTSLASMDGPGQVKPSTPVAAFNLIQSGDIRGTELIVLPIMPLFPTDQQIKKRTANTYYTEGPDIPLTVSRVLGPSGGSRGISEAAIQAAREPTPIVNPNDVPRPVSPGLYGMNRPVSPLRNSQPLVMAMVPMPPPPQIPPPMMQMTPSPVTSAFRNLPPGPSPISPMARPTSPIRYPPPTSGLHYPTLPPVPRPISVMPMNMMGPYRGF